jgi:hypothetical protein
MRCIWLRRSISVRLLFRVAGNGSSPPDLFPRPVRAGSRLSRFARRLDLLIESVPPIDGGWHRMFPETPQRFFQQIDSHRLRADLTSSSEIRSASSLLCGCAPLRGNTSSAFTPTRFSKSPTAWDSADTCEPPPPYLFLESISRIAAIFNSREYSFGHQHCSPLSRKSRARTR